MQNITVLRYFALVVTSLAGIIGVYSMLQLCASVHSYVSENSEYAKDIMKPLLLTMFIAKCHSVVLGE